MKCCFSFHNQNNFIETIDWLKSIGIDYEEQFENHHDINNDIQINIEFLNTPSILELFSNLENLDICKLTQQGVSFYLTDIPIFGIKDSEQAIISEKADGIVFCPMSNIKMINTFGNVKPNKINEVCK